MSIIHSRIDKYGNRRKLSDRKQTHTRRTAIWFKDDNVVH